MSSLLVIIGGSILALLGVMHAVFTFQSSPDRGPMTPTDADVASAMTVRGGLGLAPGIDSTLWRAWVGFNLSHSLGVVAIAAFIIAPAAADLGVVVDRPEWLIPALVLPLIYLAISIGHWFQAPTRGISLAAALIGAGVVLEVVQG